MALAAVNIQLLLGNPSVSCSISNQYQKLQLLQVRSFADEINFLQVEKLLIYRSWEYCLLLSSYSKADTELQWYQSCHDLRPEAAHTHCAGSGRAAAGQRWRLGTRAAASAALRRKLGVGRLFMPFNPLKALENAFKEGSGHRTKCEHSQLVHK